MSTLTQKEREGLEEVFLSINNSGTFYKKNKYFINFRENLQSNKIQQFLQIKGDSGKFRDKLTKNFSIFTKVKKILSK
jgi:uncharacterized beta-barrel protein YwiB (DUF1934 family)